MKIRNEIVWNFALFVHLDLFRISDFEFFQLLHFRGDLPQLFNRQRQVRHVDAA